MRPCGKRMEVSGYRATWSADDHESSHITAEKAQNVSLLSQ